MRKIYAFSLMAFYLLLTTGMFVCIVDCAVHHTATDAAKMACSTMHCAKKSTVITIAAKNMVLTW